MKTTLCSLFLSVYHIQEFKIGLNIQMSPPPSASPPPTTELADWIGGFIIEHSSKFIHSSDFTNVTVAFHSAHRYAESPHAAVTTNRKFHYIRIVVKSNRYTKTPISSRINDCRESRRALTACQRSPWRLSPMLFKYTLIPFCLVYGVGWFSRLQHLQSPTSWRIS